MKNHPLLSICIPTFNRESFLRECLQSIHALGYEDQFEVVVSDNASTDGTVTLLEEYHDRLPLRWVIQDTNIGADRNFDAVVALAEGEYCWILGSDDVIINDAIEQIIKLIRKLQSDILHFGYIQTDISLNRLHCVQPSVGQNYSSQEALANYFEKMENISMLFAFISSFVFRRSVWMSKRNRVVGWVGSNYIHMFTMHAAIAEGASLASSDRCFVLARGGNPNEFNSIPGRFISLDARTMKRLIFEIYGNSIDMWKAIGVTFRRSYPVRSLISTTAKGGLSHLIDVENILYQLGYSRALFVLLKLANNLKLLGIIKYAIDLHRTIMSKVIS